MLRRKLPHVWQPPTGFFYIYSLFPRIFPEMVPGSSSRNSADSRCNIRNLCERIRVGHGDSPFWKIKNASRTRFLRRVKQTRGTTQIAKLLFRHLFEVQQLLCTDVAYTGNAYWVIDLWGFRLRRDGNSTVLYRAHTTPDSLENSLRIPSSSTPLRIAYWICAHFITVKRHCQYIHQTKKSPCYNAYFLCHAQMYATKRRIHSFLL